MVSRIFATLLLGATSFGLTSNAQAWHHHHHRHFYGAYGVSFYSPAAYAYYSAPLYSSISITSGYWPRYRPFHFHHYRPYYTSYQTYFVPSVYYQTYYPTYYTTPTYYTPSYSPSCCEPVTCCGGTDYSTGTYNEVPTATVDSNLQIQNQRRSEYLITDNSAWVETAVELIDQMTARGGYTEAEQACLHLISVRNNVSPAVHLRTGLLALKNGKSMQVAAEQFRAASVSESMDVVIDSLPSLFSDALGLRNFEAVEPFVQDASKQLLQGTNSNHPKVILASERSGEELNATAVPKIDADARIVLDTMLRISGNHAKADAISNALERLPNL